MVPDRDPAAAETQAAQHELKEDCGDGQEGDGGRKGKKRRHVRVAFLQDKYEPLVDEAAQEKAREKKARKKAQLKKVKKNVGKVLRVTWKCLMLGLHNLAHGYSTPITVAATFAPSFYPGRR